MDNDELADQIKTHLKAMLRCNSKEDATTWMAQAYNLLDTCLRDLQKPKVFQVEGSYGEKTFSLAKPSALILPKQQRIITPHQAWFDATTVVYGQKYQDRAWTAKDTRRLEKENARRAAENFSKRQRLIAKLSR